MRANPAQRGQQDRPVDVRCACGAVLVTLEAGARPQRGRATGPEVTCSGCGATRRLPASVVR
jgi:hypothetical protein